MIEGKLSYHRITYRPTENPFHSGTDIEDVPLKRVVSLTVTYLKRIRSDPHYLEFWYGKVMHPTQAAYVYSYTQSEIMVEKDPPFTKEEFVEFKELVTKEYQRRYG